MGSAEILTSALVRVVAQEIGRVALLGTGVAPQPQGTLNFNSVGSVAAGGTLTNHDKLLGVLQTLQEANAVEPYTFIEAPRTDIALAKLKSATTNEPLPLPPALERVAFKPATQIPTDLGGGTESVVIACNVSECWLGIRMQAFVEVLREKYAANYRYSFQVSMRADVQLAREASSCALTGTTAT